MDAGESEVRRGASGSVELVIGTRGSELAMWQARHVRNLLREARTEHEVEIREIETAGDRRSGSSIPSSSTGIFTSAIEERLLAGDVDVAVHSMKDLPTDMPEGLVIAAVPERSDPADVLVTDDARSLDQLPHGATVLTGSPRRKAQLRALRPDVGVEGIAGNVPTRLEKLMSSDAQGLVLAAAGLRRLGLAEDRSCRLAPSHFIPSPGQGALAVQVRQDDAEAVESCAGIDHGPSRLAVAAERAMLAELGAGCSVPAGGYARFRQGSSRLQLKGMVGSPEGQPLLRDGQSADVQTEEEADRLGRRLARRLHDMGADEILAEFYADREDE